MNTLGLLGFGIFFLIWFIIANVGIINPLFIESPEIVVVRLAQMIADTQILDDLIKTLYRMFFGLDIALVVGIPIGLALGYSKIAYRILEPLVDFGRSIPATALFPLFLLFFTIGDFGKIAVVVFGTSLLIIVNTMYGVHYANTSRIMLAKTFGASKYQIMKVLYFEALPHTVAGIRLAVSLALVLVVVTEMFLGISEDGLGLVIYDSYQTRKVADMYAAILLTGVLGYVLNLVTKAIERRMTHWTIVAPTITVKNK